MKCTICPNNCNINRNENLGKCLSNDNIHISKADIFMYEEPCISGTNGSGNIFFSNCNLKCIYCQNYEINTSPNSGKEISVNDLSDIMLELQAKKVHNINLVTPTIYAKNIALAIDISKQKGLKIPIIYNTSGYEKEDIISSLEGKIDIYMPDLKYSNDDLGANLSHVTKYNTYTIKAIVKMLEQVGSPFFDKNGILEKGVIIRHLVLPNHIENSIEVLKQIKKYFGNYVIVSAMMQYFPTRNVKNKEYLKYGLNQKLNKGDYEKIFETLKHLDFKYCYIQDLESNSEQYVPNWNWL